MSLRNRTLLLIALSFFIMIAVLFFISNRLLTDSYARLEQERVQMSLQQVQNALNNDLQGLSAITGDWARWDETYDFILGNLPQYTTQHLSSVVTILNLGVQNVLYVDPNQKIAFSQAANQETGEEIAVSDDVIQLLNDVRVNRPPDDVEVQGGLIGINGIPSLVAFAPITRNEGLPPSAGTVVFTRYLDESVIASFADALQLPLEMYAVSDANLPIDVQRAVKQVSRQNPQFVQEVNEELTAGYILFNDLNNAPLLIARIELPRDVSAQGRTTISTFILALVITGVIVMILFAIVLEKTVLSRMANLSESIEKIEAGSDKSARVFVSGRDELANLGDGINQMLSRMETYQRSIQDSETRFRAIVSAAPLLIWVIDRDEKLTFLEGSAIKTLSLHPNRLLEQTATTIQDQIGVELPLLRRAFNGEDASSQIHIGDAIFSTAYRALRDDNQSVIGVVGVATDITRIERAEIALEQKTRELERARELLRSTIGQISDAMRRNADIHEIQTYVDFARRELNKS